MKNVIVALGLVDWESNFVSGIGHPMFGMSVQRRCVDGVDIRAAIQVLECHGVVITDATPRIDQDLISELREQDIPIIAITSNSNFWNDKGVIQCVELDSKNPLTALKLVAQLIRGQSQSSVTELPAAGLHVVVAGFGGASGRTTTVKELGWQMSLRNLGTVMVDADTYGPSLDQELGLDPNASNLLELCRVLEKKSGQDFEFKELITETKSGLAVLPGIPRVSRWTDLRISALRELWQKAKQNFDVVVTDVGAVLEIDHSMMHETSLPRRHAASLTALESADVTVICGRADSVGITRLVRGYLEFHDLFAKSNVYVLLWGTTNESQAQDVKNAVTRHTGLESVSCIDLDWELSRKALQQGGFMSELNSNALFAKQYEVLAGLIISESKLAQTLIPTTKKTKLVRKISRRVA